MKGVADFPISSGRKWWNHYFSPHILQPIWWSIEIKTLSGILMKDLLLKLHRIEHFTSNRVKKESETSWWLNKVFEAQGNKHITNHQFFMITKASIYPSPTHTHTVVDRQNNIKEEAKSKLTVTLRGLTKE